MTAVIYTEFLSHHWWAWLILIAVCLVVAAWIKYTP